MAGAKRRTTHHKQNECESTTTKTKKAHDKPNEKKENRNPKQKEKDVIIDTINIIMRSVCSQRVVGSERERARENSSCARLM